MTVEASVATPAQGPDRGTDGEPKSSRAIGRYNASFDGLRWIAMSVMLAFHAGFQWAQGAAFSLSMFFTLSGFLITSLLLRNRDDRGRPDLRQFWTKRFRRLMPAAVLTLAGIVVFAVPFADASQLAKLPGQVIAALFYVVNWYFIGTNQSYVAQFASPSPVVHFWSLSVEEQFYIIMPLLLILLLRRTRSIKTLGYFFAAAAVASAAWMVTLYHLGASIDRLYYGTDTRAAEFLVGAALACLFLHKPPRLTDRLRRFLTVASFVVLGITIWLWTSVPITNPLPYMGGYFVFSVLTAVLITGLHMGAGPLPRAFAWAPLAALGRITYGVYLVQWPIFLWLDEEHTGLPRYPLLVIQLALILGLATLSYHFIEMPIRSGKRLVGSHGWMAAVGMAMVICVGVVAVSAHGPGDPLAPLANVSSAAPPFVVDDGKLDILVIGDTSGQALGGAVASVAKGDANVKVVNGPAFGCPPSSSSSTDCADWDTSWRNAINDNDPDVVLFAVSNWSASDIAAASGLGPSATTDQLTDWTSNALNRGIDTLTTRGATVLWTPVLSSDLDIQSAWTTTPFGQVMSKLPSQRNDIKRFGFTHAGPVGAPIKELGFHAQNAKAVLEQAKPLQTRVAGSAKRVLIDGDSLAASLGVGFERWSQETGKATVWTAALLGCGFVYEGEINFPLLPGVPGQCNSVQDQWRSQIDRFRPDVVVVSSTVWDLIPRKLPQWDSFLGPGDPRFDDFLLGRYREAMDIFTAHGARVVWLDAPCFMGDFQKQADHLNHTLLPKLHDAYPDKLEIYPFDQLVCPTGDEPKELGGVPNPRPDSIHFSPDAAYWVAQQVGPHLVS